MSAYEIPASQLRQFAFCPRIPYIVLALGAQPPAPPWAAQGARWHVERIAMERRRALAAYGLADARPHAEMPLFSQEHGLTGRPDLVLETERSVAIVECKAGKATVNKGLMLQMHAYSVMAEQTFGKPSVACLLVSANGRHMKKVAFPSGFPDEFMRALADMRAMLDAGNMPSSSASTGKCAQCEYLNWCGDRI